MDDNVKEQTKGECNIKGAEEFQTMVIETKYNKGLIIEIE